MVWFASLLGADSRVPDDGGGTIRNHVLCIGGPVRELEVPIR